MGRAMLWSAIALTLMIGLVQVPLGRGYNYNTCHCWSEMNDTLKDKIPTLTNPPSVKTYQYLGVIPRAGDTYIGCLCTDVTRIQTTLTVSNEEIYNEIGNQTVIQIPPNITSAINKIFEDEDADGIVINFKINFDSLETSPQSTWVVEIRTRSFDLNADDKIEAMFDAATNNTYHLDNVGSFLKLKFSVIQCEDDPMSASSFGSRQWSSYKLAGTVAKYACDAGYFITKPSLAFSQCSHENLTWTIPGVDITCQKGCQADPPTEPLFATKNWKETQRADGDAAIYTCRGDRYDQSDPGPSIRYKSADGKNGSSVCDGNSATWSALRSDFKCERILCSPKDIYQVPAYGNNTWKKIDEPKSGTVITYFCQPGYVPDIKETLKVECDRYGKWTNIPVFKCITEEKARELGILVDSSENYDYYEDGPQHLTVNADSVSYFTMVSLPSIGGMGIVIFGILCFTRMNSRMYILCTGNARKTRYLDA